LPINTVLFFPQSLEVIAELVQLLLMPKVVIMVAI